MKKFKENFYKLLINRENFYMKQYYSNFYKEEVFFAVKELREGIYCVLITSDERKEVDYSEAFTYIKSLDKSFSLNMIILANKEYTYGKEILIPNKLIINQENYEVVVCDNSCMPLKQIFDSNIKNYEMDNDNVKRKIFNYKVLTLSIIAVNILMFIITQMIIYKSSNVEVNNILQTYSGQISQDEINKKISEKINDVNNSVLISFGAKDNVLIEQGEIWRLLTCAFLHSGFIHIGCNMYSLYIIGPQINQIYGTGKYFVIYIISCITSSLLSFLMSPYSISVGASGGIFGLMGALLAFALIERNKIEKRYLSSLLQIIIINLFIGLNIKNIDNFGHIGGLLGGVLIGYIIYKISQNKGTA